MQNTYETQAIQTSYRLLFTSYTFMATFMSTYVIDVCTCSCMYLVY